MLRADQDVPLPHYLLVPFTSGDQHVSDWPGRRQAVFGIRPIREEHMEKDYNSGLSWFVPAPDDYGLGHTNISMDRF